MSRSQSRSVAVAPAERRAAVSIDPPRPVALVAAIVVAGCTGPQSALDPAESEVSPHSQQHEGSPGEDGEHLLWSVRSSQEPERGDGDPGMNQEVHEIETED
mgnify:CR=1 FL=1